MPVSRQAITKLRELLDERPDQEGLSVDYHTLATAMKSTPAWAEIDQAIIAYRAGRMSLDAVNECLSEVVGTGALKLVSNYHEKRTKNGSDETYFYFEPGPSQLQRMANITDRWVR